MLHGTIITLNVFAMMGGPAPTVTLLHSNSNVGVHVCACYIANHGLPFRQFCSRMQECDQNEIHSVITDLVIR